MMKRWLGHIPLAMILTLGLFGLSRAAQNELVPPTSGTYTGVQYSQLLGDAFRSLAGCNKGSTAPANVGGEAVDGLCWIDDSVTPWLKKRYADGNWIIEGAIDSNNGYWIGKIGGGLGSIASASTTDLGTLPQANISISGTTTIASFGSSAPAGDVKIIRFADALWLTNSSGLTVPGGYDLKTAANDRAVVTHLGSGNWEITQYTRASGIPIDVSAVGEPRMLLVASAPSLYVAGRGQALARSDYPAYLAKVTSAQTATRTSGNATLTGLSSTEGFGSGMPVEGTGLTGCTISSVTSSTTIVLSSGTCVGSSGTATVTVFLTGYGSLGDTSTVGVPDCRGSMIAGLDTIDGQTASRITAAGSSIAGTTVNARGGSQTVTLVKENVPNYTLPNTLGITGSVIFNGQIYVTDSLYFGNGGGDSNLQRANNGTNLSGTLNGSVTGSVTSGGSDTPVNKMPPVLMAKCFVRVTP